MNKTDQSRQRTPHKCRLPATIRLRRNKDVERVVFRGIDAINQSLQDTAGTSRMLICPLPFA